MDVSTNRREDTDASTNRREDADASTNQKARMDASTNERPVKGWEARLYTPEEDEAIVQFIINCEGHSQVSNVLLPVIIMNILGKGGFIFICLHNFLFTFFSSPKNSQSRILFG